MRRAILLTILLVLFTIGACSSPTSPDAHRAEGNAPADGFLARSGVFQPDIDARGRYIMGAWELFLDFDAMKAEAIPQRLAEGHFNVRRFMEEAPCATCLTLLNFIKNPDDTFNIDVQFEHPFPGLDNLSGFDVRGIAIFNGSYHFPASGLIMSDHTLGDMELLNADGYTTFFNPTDFPPGSNIPVLAYSRGKASTSLTNPAMLNGYKCFHTDIQRRLFRAGESDTRNYHIAKPQGTRIRVGYVVDACWEPPLYKPVVDPLTDFGTNANCPEAYLMDVTIGSGMMPGCGYAPYRIDAYDHQGTDTVASVTIEAPDLFDGIITNSSGTDMGAFKRFTGNIPNEMEVGEGEYRVLVGVVDSIGDPYLGTATAYTLTTATVEMAPIDYENGWRRHGRTLDNCNYNPHETQIGTDLEEYWTHQFTETMGGVFESTPTIGASFVYIVTHSLLGDRIWALDLDSGEPEWDSILKYVPDVMIYRSTPTIGNCELWVGGSSVLCFDSEDGDLLWTDEEQDKQYIQGGPVVVDDIVIIWGTDNYLSAFNAFSHEFMWDYSNGEELGCPSTPAVSDGVVYAGDMLGYAFALDIETGDEIWKTQFPKGGPRNQRQIWAPVVLADGLVWFACANCRLYGLDPVDGSIERDIPLGDQLPLASPAYDGNLLYQPLCYNATYPGSFTGPFRVLGITTDGNIEWEFEGTDREAFWSSPVVANGILWVPSDAGVIYMLDPATGDPMGPGQYALENPVLSGISILDGKLYCVDTGGKAYCLHNR